MSVSSEETPPEVDPLRYESSVAWASFEYTIDVPYVIVKMMILLQIADCCIGGRHARRRPSCVPWTE